MNGALRADYLTGLLRFARNDDCGCAGRRVDLLMIEDLLRTPTELILNRIFCTAWHHGSQAGHRPSRAGGLPMTYYCKAQFTKAMRAMSVVNPHIRFVYEGYKSLPESMTKRYELLDGEMLMVPAPATTHQIVSRNLDSGSR